MKENRAILSLCLCLLVSANLAGQGIVRFSGIDLGTEYTGFKKALKAQEFRFEKEWQQEDNIAYGVYPEALFKGEYDSELAYVRIKASHKTKKVFEVSLSLGQCVDKEEAIELGDRVRADLEAYYNTAGVVRYTKNEGGGLTMHLYQDEIHARQNKEYGSISIQVFGTFSDYYEVEFVFRSVAARNLALDEAGIDNNWIKRD